MMKILLLGKNGQVGWELRRCLHPIGKIIALGRSELDLQDKIAIRSIVNEVKPNLIVNAAAYTGVDQAEVNQKIARAVNATAPAVLAEEAKRLKAFLVHYSTDYVFDGSNIIPYTEEDKPNPINVYGLTKLEGEDLIRSTGVSHLILRTCWVYGMRGKNFLLNMRKLAQEKDELKVVNDQIGSPTWSRMIAEATALMLIQNINVEKTLTGTYHLSAEGKASWYEFARAIFNRLFTAEHEVAKLMPIPTSEYKTIAQRPDFTVLDCNKVSNDFKIKLSTWDELLNLAVEDC